MKKIHANPKFFLLMTAVALCVVLAIATVVPQAAFAQSSDPMGTPMAGETQIPTTAATPIPETTQYPLTGSGQMGAMGGMGMGAGMMDATSCPMMNGSMSGSGMTGGSMTGGGMMSGSGMELSGSNGTGMNMSMTNTGMSGMSMNASGSLLDADGRFVFWNLSPWWLLGWALLGLLVLALLGGGVFGIVTFIRQTRRPSLVANPPTQSN